MTRFKGIKVLGKEPNEIFIKDKEKDYYIRTEDEVVELLNEQQATISKQLDQIIELQDKYRILEFNHSRLEKRNKAQYEKIGEQQATISALKKENEQLRKDLNDCEKFRYTVFKRIGELNNE